MKDKGKIKVVKMTPILKHKLYEWDKFSGLNNDGYDRIEKYISLRGLKEYFQEQSKEKLEDRKQFRYVLKGERGKILGFICFMTYKARDKNVMYVQSIAIHPNEHHKGYGKKLLTTILENPKKFIKETPDIVSAHVCHSNQESRSLFKGLGERYNIYSIDEVFDIIEVNYKSIKEKQTEKEN